MTDHPDRRVSSGALPAAGVVAELLDEAHQRFRDVTDGRPSSVYPALERADHDLIPATRTPGNRWGNRAHASAPARASSSSVWASWSPSPAIVSGMVKDRAERVRG